MRNRSLNSQMARSTKSDKIVGVVGGISDEKTSARRYVMNIEGSPVFGADSTKRTLPIPVEHCKPDTAPMSTKFKIASAAIVWMSRANGRFFRTIVRTEATAPFYLTGKCTKSPAAVRTSYLRCCNKSCISTFHGAMSNSLTIVLKHNSANSARNWLTCVGPTPISLTLPAAKPKLCIFLDAIVWSTKGFAAIRALIISVTLHHRRRVTCSAAIHHGTIIRSKLFFALEAGLVH